VATPVVVVAVVGQNLFDTKVVVAEEDTGVAVEEEIGVVVEEDTGVAVEEDIGVAVEEDTGVVEEDSQVGLVAEVDYRE
jgi:hypothetical protein